MTPSQEAAMRQALEALESVEWYGAGSGWMVDANAIEGAIAALKAALAEQEHKPNCALLQIPSRDCDCQEPVQEPVANEIHGCHGGEGSTLPEQSVQEPVAWMTHGNDSLPLFHRTRAGALAWGAEPQPLYTAQPQRTPSALITPRGSLGEEA